jgi:hypothetical protein
MISPKARGQSYYSIAGLQLLTNAFSTATCDRVLELPSINEASIGIVRVSIILSELPQIREELRLVFGVPAGDCGTP